MYFTVIADKERKLCQPFKMLAGFGNKYTMRVTAIDPN
jgi:hypothetical protein